MPIGLPYINGLSKSDLHVHLDGALQKKDLLSIARTQGIELDKRKLAHYPDAGPFDANEDFAGFQRFLDCFDLVKEVTQSADGIYEMVMAVLTQLNAEGVHHAELRMAPNYHTKEGLTMEEVVANTLEAMEHAAPDGITSKLVLAIPREIAYTGDESGNNYTAEDIVAVARNFVDNGVVGIDLACAEHFNPDPYFEVFRSTIGTDLKRYVHAGEAGPNRLENIEKAVREMHADAIGHALPLGVDPRLDPLLDEIIRRRIRIERCPLSNLAMSASDKNLDGLDNLLNRGANLVIASDDPGIFGVETNLSHNLLYVVNKLGLKWWDLEDLVKANNQAAF